MRQSKGKMNEREGRCEEALLCSMMLHMWLYSTLLLPVLGGSSLEASGPAGGNESDLLAWGGVPPHCGGVPNMLMVTTTVRMLHRVHGHTTHLQDCTRQ